VITWTDVAIKKIRMNGGSIYHLKFDKKSGKYKQLQSEPSRLQLNQCC